jgi:membrane fusion protein, copper/silver efflux system
MSEDQKKSVKDLAPKSPIGFWTGRKVLAIFALGLLCGWLWADDDDQATDSNDETAIAHEHGGTLGDASSGDAGAMEPESGEPEPAEWTCSMHPTVKLPEFGPCPICFMDLIPAVASGGSPFELKMDPIAVALAEIVTVPVERKAAERTIEMVGKLAIDQTGVAEIASWMQGRVERVYVDSVGIPVASGEHLLEIYSPELFAAEQAHLEALKKPGRLSDATRGRLRQLGMQQEQISALEQSGEPRPSETVFAPQGGVVLHLDARQGAYVKEGSHLYTIADLSNLWLNLEAYESDLAMLHYGQQVHFQVAAWPGKQFSGRIALISPLLNDRTRTVSVRVLVENADGKLRPDMYAQAQVEVKLDGFGRAQQPDLSAHWTCTMHPDILAAGPGSCPQCEMPLVPASEVAQIAANSAPLLIPSTAPMWTGTRSIVYVRLPGDEPVFEGREVVLGPRAGDFYVVLEGLEEGELVVANGAFKLDAELQLQGKWSMMKRPPSSDAPTAKHVHEQSFQVDSAPTAFQQSLGQVVLPYLALQTALAADQFDDALMAATDLSFALDLADSSELKANQQQRWTGLQDGLREHTLLAMEAEDIETIRRNFDGISRAMIEAVQVYGQIGGGDVQLAYCPMAFDDFGADWLQLGSTIANPYFGASMLRCGSVEKSLPAVQE